MMNSTLSKFIIFVAGAGIGAAVTYKIMQKKCDERIQEEVDSVIEVFSKRKKDEETKTEEKSEETDEPDGSNTEEESERFEKIVRGEGYVAYRNDKINNKEDDDMIAPYVISPDEFDEIGYETVSLTYYSDGTLVDELGTVIEDIENVVGEDFASHIGDYEDDSIHIRNDSLKTDFEIIQVYGSYYGA